MTREAAQKALQQMHATRTVSNEAVIAWHACCAEQVRQARPEVPPLNPAVSPIDLLLAAGLWMEMTEAGQSDPGFPFDYLSALVLPDLEGPQPKSKMPRQAVGAMAIMWLGIGSVVACCALGGASAFPEWTYMVLYPLSFIVIIGAYRRLGTMVPIQSVRPGAPLHAPAMRAIQWSQQRQASGSAACFGWSCDKASIAEGETAAVSFGGQLTDAVGSDCCRLYGRWRLFPFFWDSPLPRDPRQRRREILWKSLPLFFFGLIGWNDPKALAFVVGFVLVFGIPLGFLLCLVSSRLFTRRWWRLLQGGFEGALSGTVSDRSVQWVEGGGVFAWSDFILAKLDDSAMLLYVGRSDALPIHRTMCASDADWQQVCCWLKASGVPVHRFRS